MKIMEILAVMFGVFVAFFFILVMNVLIGYACPCIISYVGCSFFDGLCQYSGLMIILFLMVIVGTLAFYLKNTKREKDGR